MEEAWNVLLPSPPSAQAALDESRVYIPLQSGELVAVVRESGADAWSATVATAWTPLLGDMALFVAGTDAVVALEKSTGTPLWRSPVEAETIAAPVLHGDLVVVLTKPDQLVAFRTSDGSQAWRVTVSVAAAPRVVADESGVVVASGGRISKVSRNGGRLEWTRDLPGILGRPLIDGDRVFVGSTANYFYSLDAGNGRVDWRYAVGGDVVGAAVGDAGVLYMASLDNLLRALRRNSGNQVWKRSLSTRTVAPPSTFGGLVLVPGNTPTLSAFNAITGDPIASFSAPADLQGVPSIDAMLVPFRVAMIAVTRDARAIGLRPTGMMFREQPLVPLQILPGRSLNREPLAPPAHDAAPSVAPR